MSIRSDSYSSVDEILAFTRHLLDGQSTFNTLTRPTLTEIEKFIDRASALLNVALAAKGFTPASIYANAVTKLACDDWVTQQAVKYVHYAQRNTGIFSDQNETFKMDSAAEFVDSLTDGFINLGVSPNTSNTGLLAYAAIDAQSERSDPSDTTREQPLFSRRLWDNA